MRHMTSAPIDTARGPSMLRDCVLEIYVTYKHNSKRQCSSLALSVMAARLDIRPHAQTLKRDSIFGPLSTHCVTGSQKLELPKSHCCPDFTPRLNLADNHKNSSPTVCAWAGHVNLKSTDFSK